MRFEFDWPYIRRHSLRPVASAVVAMSLLGAAHWLHGEQVQKLDRISISQNQVHEDYDSLVHQRRLVERYHRRYERFAQLGFIGRESRLDWVETLRTTASTLSIPRLSYSIEPQVRMIPPVQSAEGWQDVEVHASRVQLSMGLLHELDLLRFFDALQASAPGLLKVDRCELSWQAAPGNIASAASNLSADCAVQLFSVITSDVTSEVPL